LVAAWREGLLAQAVLAGATKGYRHHPQLARFRRAASPRAAIASYLRGLHAEAVARGYAFDGAKISRARARPKLSVTSGQLRYEWQHLRAKLRARDRAWAARLGVVRRVMPAPVFRTVPGGVEAWERRPRPPATRRPSSGHGPRNVRRSAA
jgi:hypothetical protein